MGFSLSEKRAIMGSKLTIQNLPPELTCRIGLLLEPQVLSKEDVYKTARIFATLSLVNKHFRKNFDCVERLKN